ncbi:hypothetical protein KR215_005259, partial [Drosophila sulfurigaster]
LEMFTAQTFTQLSDSSKCVASCGKFNLQIGKKLYYVESKEKVNWYKAVNNCRKMGGYLLNIESSTEMDLFAALYPSDSLWTSLNRYCLAGNREFISIVTGEPLPYARWDLGEPNNFGGREYCLELKQYKFNDAVCANEQKFACEAKIM